MNIIMGAGDFAREVYEYHRFLGIDVFGFYDEKSEKTLLKEKPIFKNFNEISNINNKKFIVGTGDCKVNKHFYNLIINNNLNLSDAIICDSYVGNNVKIDKGSIICPKSVLTCDIEVGKFSVINISSTIGHDCKISDFVVISPNCSLSGHTILEECTFLGTNVITIPKIKINKNIKVGAAATIINNLEEIGTYIGTPARRINND